MKTSAAVLNGPGQAFDIETIEVAEPKAGEIRVRVHAVGICHTDLVAATGLFGTPFPMVLGHEGAGVVEAVGSGVSKVAVGDKVLLTFNSCGHCPRCGSDEPAYCFEFVPRNMICARSDGTSRLSRENGDVIADNFFGQSSFAGYSVANERNVMKLDPDDDLVSLAPLGCGVQTGAGAVLRSLGGQKGESLVVLGGGAVGLSAVLGGKLAGCNPIIVIEPQAGRRTLAMELGATHAIDPAAGETAEAVRAIVPTGVDLAVDTTGNVAALQSALNMMANKGRLGLIGVPSAVDAAVSVPLMQWITIGGTVRGIIEGDSNVDGFLSELVAHKKAGRLPIEKFVKAYPLDQINQAIDDAHHGKCVKAVLTF
jgi:aryl-alcohol dehydrogenase